MAATRARSERAGPKPPTIAEYAATVIGHRRLRPATVALYEKLLRLAIVPAFGDRQPSEISVADVTAWYRSMNATPTQQANAYGLLKSILKDAVEDGLIATNPCRVRAGGQKSRAREVEVLSVEQLTEYLAAVPEARRVPLLLAGWCGCVQARCGRCASVISTWTPAWCGCGRPSSGSRATC